MATADALDGGRESFERQAWSDAYEQLSAADQQGRLDPEDLERLATAAHLIGRYGESPDLFLRAHNAYRDGGDTVRAARSAFFVGLFLVDGGELARGRGWIARAQRLLDDGEHDCVEQGYVLLPDALDRLAEGDVTTAHAIYGRALKIGERFGDPDLIALSREGQGEALIRLGEIEEGVAQLDEVMVAVTAGELSPLVAGSIYCGVIPVCREIFDLRRAQEWTSAMTHWCESQPDLVPDRGLCLVYRAEVMQLHGAWVEAFEEARRACELLSGLPGQSGIGAAYYQQGELRRLQGDYANAEEAYRRASKWGHEPQPGLALLRLAQGEVDVAQAAIRRAMEESQDPMSRSKLLPACVEILLASGDVDGARAAADDLAQLAAELDAALLDAVSGHAAGAVLLAEGDPRAALDWLRGAWGILQDLEAPYEAARVRVLIGLACRALGDDDTAELELDAARAVFQQLGAGPDLARVKDLSRKAASKPAGGLTGREVQVLTLVATGKSNREIATTLTISEHTVRRHLQNIFAKVGVSSRAEATAYAYQHDLV